MCGRFTQTAPPEECHVRGSKRSKSTTESLSERDSHWRLFGVMPNVDLLSLFLNPLCESLSPERQLYDTGRHTSATDPIFHE